MMKIEVSNKIELQIGEHTVAMTMLEVRSLIKRLQEVIGESDPPRLTSALTYPPGVRGYSLDGQNILCTTTKATDVQHTSGTDIAFDRGE